MKSQKKALLILLGILFLLTVIILGGIKLYRVKQARQSGILLAFDDYNVENWSSYFDLFDQYGVKVTFFVNCTEPTDFCYEAIERGHEIGFHTTSHFKVAESTPEEIQTGVIDPIETFREKGIELTTFAYPYGVYNEETNELLLQHYNVLRGAYYYDLHSKADLRHGFVDSYSLDNINHASDEEFEASITRILTELSDNVGAVASLYSHAISDGDWCVYEDRLVFLFEKANELGLKFYTFQELQKD